MITVRSFMGRLWARFLSLIHPATIGRTLAAILRGFAISVGKIFAYLRADDKSHLLKSNPLKHHQETARRRTVVALSLFVDAAALAVFVYVEWRSPWWYPVTFWGLIHVVVFFLIGRTGPVMREVYTGKIATENKITRIVDEITLSPSARSNGAKTKIVTPAHQLAHTKGYSVSVRVHSSGKPEKLENGAADFAHKHESVGVRQVFVSKSSSDASVHTITVLESDPWESPSTRSPVAAAPREINTWSEPVSLGVNPDGTPYVVTLTEAGDGACYLLASAPRMGKTNWIRNILIHLMLDPFTRIHLIDGKGVDFSPAKSVCTNYVGEDNMDDAELLADAMIVLSAVEQEIRRRRPILVGMDVDHLTEDLARKYDMPTEWVVIDELSVFTEDMMSTRKQAAIAFIDKLSWIVRMGPALGVFCILATQRPSEKSIPAPLRGMIRNRIALYVGDQPSSYAITGKSGDAVRADRLDMNQKGVAVVVGHGTVRAHRVTRHDMHAVAAVARRVRGGDVSSENLTPPIISACLTEFGDRDRIRSEELAHALGMTVTNLADALRPFGVQPMSIRFGDGTARGYYLADVEAATPATAEARRQGRNRGV